VIEHDGTLAERGVALRMTMNECLDCHDATKGPRESDCASCHVEIRAGVAPPSHRASWTRYHGSVFRSRSSERNDQCALCHKPSECANCHHIELPRESHELLASTRSRSHGEHGSPELHDVSRH
jgi:hypothetical protein